MATLRVSKGLSWDAISAVRKKERILMSRVCKDCPTGKQNKTQTPFLTKKKNAYRCEFQTFPLPMREIELRVKEIWMKIIKVFVVNQQEHRNGLVASRLRQVASQNNGRLVLDGNYNNLFGFDPIPFQRKVLAIHVRLNGEEHHLRANEGQHFEFPS